MSNSQALVTISPNQAIAEMRACFKSGNVPLFLGSPGIGKSAMAQAVADQFNLELIDVRLSSYLPEDLNGFPRIGEKYAEFVPFDTFPTEERPLPVGKKGWLLFLDEFTSIDKDTQAPTYKLVYDRFVGNKRLHPNVFIACAGNRLEDNAIAMKLSTALRSRLITYQIEVSFDEWMHWANLNNKQVDEKMEPNIHPYIRAYLNFKNGDLLDFDPDRDDHTFRCPRTWHFLSNFAYVDNIDMSKLARVQGTIGTSGAVEFITFLSEFDKLPALQDIFDKPDSTIIPPNASTRYALVTILADHHEADKHLDAILAYTSRFEPEFQIVFCNALMAKYPKLRVNPKLVKHATQFIKDMESNG